jgi:hypothetical protein
MQRARFLVATALTVALVSPRSEAATSFGVAATSAVPENAIAFQAVDLDASGRLDLALVTTGGDVYVSLDPASGDYSAIAWQLVSSVPLDVQSAYYGGLSAADLDADGLPELLVYGSPKNELAICRATLLANLGGGFFGPGADLAILKERPDDVVFGCTDVELADFDGNGSVDVALTFSSQPADAYNGLDTYVNVFLGAGDGAFAAPKLYALAPDPLPWVSFAMASGDFDGDGVLDLGFGSMVRWLSGATDWRVETLLGDGAGGFVGGTTKPFECSSCEVIVADAQDFDGDGRDEFLVPGSSPDSAPYDYPVLYFPNAGDGSFGDPLGLGEYNGTVSVETEDVTGDDLPDILLMSSSDQVTLLEGHGDGTFGAPERFVTGATITSGALADLDGDGASELVLLGDYAYAPGLSIARGAAPARRFVLPRVSRVPSGYPSQLSPAADFDGDGQLDVLAFDYGAIELMLGTGDGLFVPGGSTPSEGSPWPMPVLDLNHDGRLDLVRASGDGYAASFGNPDGTFSAVPPIASQQETMLAAVGDINDDGYPDLAAYGYPSYAVAIYLGDAAFGFTRSITIDPGVYASDIYLADVNADGHLDLFVGAQSVVQTSGSTPPPLASHVWLGDGHAGFSEGAPVDAHGWKVLLRDVDGDGAPDVLSPEALCLGAGDGTFAAPAPLPSAGASQIDLADVDADGRLDLLFLGDGLRVARGGGDGTFETPERLASSQGWLTFSVGQWSGSAALDVLAVHSYYTDDGGGADLLLLENGAHPCGATP